ncbi:hypothetical protein SDC9_114626 [bioreactor metagenome]|uniref:Uncharacterized protein n=1 Tax=bioreactor metagenome TaxID=1076179 RepID=A0A645BR76_9ZZZZ
MKKSKIYYLLFWVIGLVMAELWRYLLKNSNIPEFYKWLSGIVIIILVFFTINKVKRLNNTNKDNWT